MKKPTLRTGGGSCVGREKWSSRSSLRGGGVENMDRH